LKVQAAIRRDPSQGKKEGKKGEGGLLEHFSSKPPIKGEGRFGSVNDEG